MTRKQSSSDHGPVEFRLLVMSAFYHPQPAARSLARRFLEEWAQCLTPSVDPRRVEHLIRSATGTVLEPFVFEEPDVECAVFLARIAFSPHVGATRFRLVSRDNLGRDGGLVLTHSGKAYFIERFIGGSHRIRVSTGWSFAPATFPGLKRNLAATRPAILSSGPEGFEIRVGGLDKVKSYAEAGGFLHGTPTRLRSIGLTLRGAGKTLTMKPSGPEAMIRVMAHMAAGDRMELGRYDSDTPRWHAPRETLPRLLVALRMPDERPVRLPTLRAVAETDLDGLHCPMPGFPRHPGLAEKIALSRWLPVADPWLEELFGHIHPPPTESS